MPSNDRRVQSLCPRSYNKQENRQKWLPEILPSLKTGFSRHIFQNIRGFKSWDSFMSLQKFRKWGAQCLHFSDTKLEKGKERPVEHSFGKLWHQCNENYKPKPPKWIHSYGTQGIHSHVGGTSSVIGGIWSSRVGVHITDHRGWGRWAGVCLVGKSGRKIVLLSVYGPTFTANSKGSSWSHQSTCLDKMKEKGLQVENNPTNQFLADLSREVVQWHGKGAHVLIGGDFNLNARRLSNWAFNFLLTNVSNLHLGESATYFSGKTSSAIDHVFVSTALWKEGLVDKVYMYTDECGNTDHSPLIVDIDLSSYLHLNGEDITPSIKKCPIRFSCKSSKMVQNFQQLCVKNYAAAALSHASHLDKNEVMSQLSILTKMVVTAGQNSCSYVPNCRDTFDGWSPTAVRLAFHVRKFSKIIKRWDRKWSPTALLHYIKFLAPKLDLKQYGLEIPKHVNMVRTWIELLRQKNFILRRQLQGRFRCEMRKKMGYRIRQREELREKMKYKQYLSRIFNKSLGGPLDHITIKGTSESMTDDIISDPLGLSTHLLSHMSDWFGKGREAWYLKAGSKQLWLREEGHILRLNIAEGNLTQAKELCPARFHYILKALQRKRKSDGTFITELDYTDCNNPISRDEWLTYWKSKRKGSAPGPSNLSVDMMKALPVDISDHFRLLVNHVWSNGWIYDDWTKSIMLLIPKVTGNHDINKIRPLRLLEVLRKALFGIIRSRILKVWEHTKILSHHQYAFLPGKSTVHPLLNLTLIIQHSLMYRQELHIISQDIRRAFDSVEGTLGKEMPLRRLGVPEKFIKFLLDYDDCDQNDILTAYGRSSDILGTDEGYFHAERGWGQGSEEGPAGWVAFQDVMLTLMETADIPKYRFDDKMGSFEDLFGQSFADDSIWFAPSKEAAAARCTVANDFLEFMGGSLSIPKCIYSSLRWKNPYSGPTSELHHLRLNDIDGRFEVSFESSCNPKEMRSISPSISFKYLGVLFNLKGKWNHQLDALKSRLSDQISAIYYKTISTTGSWLICQTVLKPQILYGIIPIGDCDQQIDDIERIAKRFFYRQAKLPITFPTDLLGSHEHRMGVGWIPWKEERYIQQCIVLLQLINEDSTSGRLIQLSLTLLKNKCSSHFDGDCNIWTRYPLKWMNSYGLSLGEQSKLFTSSGFRENDTRILDHFQSVAVPKSLYNVIVKWISNLGIVWVSDIVDEDGCSPAPWLKSRQELRNELDGKNLIYDSLFIDGKLPDQLRVGKWLRTPPFRAHSYSVVQTPYGLCQILEIHKSKVKCALLYPDYQSIRNSRSCNFSPLRYLTGKFHCIVDTKQICSVRAYPGNQRRGLFVQTRQAPVISFNVYCRLETLRTFQQIMQARPSPSVPSHSIDSGEFIDSQVDLANWITIKDSPSTIFHVFTDGSVNSRGNRSTYCWLLGESISSKSIKQIHRVMGRTPPSTGSDLTSFRAEAMAILSALHSLFPMVTTGNVTIHTDSESCKATWERLPHMRLSGIIRQEDKDIWSQLKEHYSNWGDKIQINWIKAHMDTIAPSEMTWHHHGNVLADEGATNAYAIYTQLKAPTLSYSTKYVLLFHNKAVTADYLKFLKELVKLRHSQKYIERIEQKYEIELLKSTNWSAFQSLTKQWNVGVRIRNIKLLWGFIATASILARRGCEEVDGTANCKLCNQGLVESSWHIFGECNHKDIIRIRKSLPTTICSLLLNSGVDSNLANIISSSWSLSDGGVFKAMTSEEMNELILDLGHDGQWTDTLLEHLRKQCNMSIWEKSGFLQNAWVETLLHAGLHKRKACSVTSKIINCIINTIQQCWQVRNGIYHQRVKERNMNNKKNIEARLEEIINGPMYDDRPETRVNLLEISRRYPIRDKRRLLQNLENKVTNANVEAITMHQHFTSILPSKTKYKETRFSVPHKSSFRVRIENPPPPIPNKAIVDASPPKVPSNSVYNENCSSSTSDKESISSTSCQISTRKQPSTNNIVITHQQCRRRRKRKRTDCNSYNFQKHLKQTPQNYKRSSTVMNASANSTTRHSKRPCLSSTLITNGNGSNEHLKKFSRTGIG